MRKRLEGKSVKTAYLGLLLALAVIFGYIEALIPVPVPIPGIKLGLANLVIAAVLYFYGPFEAMTVTDDEETLRKNGGRPAETGDKALLIDLWLMSCRVLKRDMGHKMM